MKASKLILIIIALAVLILIVIFPNICIDAATVSLSMWLTLVVPSLLPFFIGASILMETGIVRVVGAFFEPVTRFFFSLPGESAYVFAASALTGYPMGAKICAELYQAGKMDLETAQRTVCFTSIGGPLFILGTVAYGMLNFQAAGHYIAAAHYIGAVAAGALTGVFYKKRRFPAMRYLTGIRQALSGFKADIRANKKDIGDILEQAVMKGVTTMLLIGGMMVIFNVLSGLMQKLGVIGFLCDAFSGIGVPGPISRPVINGVLEMTNGCRIASASALDMGVKIPITALIISFGGFSIHAQTYSIAARSGLKLRFFMTAKLVQAVVSFLAAFVLFNAIPADTAAFADSGPAFSGAGYAYAGSAFAAAAAILLFIIFLIRKKRPAVREAGRVKPF
jgi:sporulation integral membrane protein YlbJ